MSAPTALRPTADEMGRAAELAAELGRTPTSNEIKNALGVGRAVANRVLAELDQSGTDHLADHPRAGGPDQADHPALTVVRDTVPTPRAGIDPAATDRLWSAGPDHADQPDRSTMDHPGPEVADGPRARDADHSSPQVTAGGPVADHAADRPGLVEQSTTDHPADDAGDNDANRPARTGYGPVTAVADHMADHARTTQSVDGPVASPMAAADPAPAVDHSAEQTGYGPVAPETDHPGPVERATPTGFTRRVRRLEEQAAEARQLRALHVQPDIRAVVLMRQRRMWTLLASVVLLITLASTAVNVQHFAAGGAPSGSTPWLAGWLVDPAFSLLLVGILIARGNLTAVRHQVTDGVVLTVEYGVLAAVLIMNVTPEIEATSIDPGQVALHAFLPLLAFGTASALTRIQDHYAAAIDELYPAVTT